MLGREAKPKISKARISCGILLIAFGLLGGISQLTKTERHNPNSGEDVLRYSSRPLDNAITIVVTIVLLAIGLSMTGVLRRVFPKKNTKGE